MKIFVTSDTHFGHANIIKYCDRPFASIAEMDEALIQRWNSRVTNKDVVYHLGDFAFANRERIFDIIDRLEFKELFIVPGNHDETLLDAWRDVNGPFPNDVSVLEPIHNLSYQSKIFVLCHFPMAEWNKSHKGSIHLHGHTHNGSGHHKTPKIDRRYDIGVDAFGGPIEITGDLRFLNNPKGWA